MSLTEGNSIFKKIGSKFKSGLDKAKSAIFGDIQANGKVLDNVYTDGYSIISFDKNKKIDKTNKTKNFADAYDTAQKLSVDPNNAVVYVYGGIINKEEDARNPERDNFLCAYQKGKAVDNKNYNKIEAKVLSIKNNNKINDKGKVSELEIKAAEKPKEEPQKVAKEEESNLRFAETPEEKAFVKEVQTRCANIVKTIKNAGLDTSPLINTITKAGKKIKVYNTNKIKKIQPIFNEALQEEIDKETLGTELIFPIEEIK